VEESLKGDSGGFFVHDSSIIDAPCEIGRGTQIWHFCHVMKDAVIGEDCRIGQNVFIASGVQIGNNCKIQNNVSVYAGVTLEDDVFCGPSIVFTNVLTPRSAFPRQDRYARTLVKRGATIGANATILCGITIGEHAMIGAGAVVTRDVPPYALIYGNPGRIQGYACECGAALTPRPSPNSGRAEYICCAECGRGYRNSDEGIERAE
jgi:UDP-2-acetamido-3-amino-2,3-dideoxy-glucuronate N-acetyltransferase